MGELPPENEETTAFYCDMSALAPVERLAHQELIGNLFGQLVEEKRELADGFAYRFAGEHYTLVAAFIANERRCCPFLTFRLEVSPQRGPLWLQLTAPGESKAFLSAELGAIVAQALYARG